MSSLGSGKMRFTAGECLRIEYYCTGWPRYHNNFKWINHHFLVEQSSVLISTWSSVYGSDGRQTIVPISQVMQRKVTGDIMIEFALQ